MSVHPDQLVCLKCGYREISRHNKHCPDCPLIMMVFESAALRLGWIVITIGPVQVEFTPQPDEVPGQLSLWGTIA